MELSNLEKRVLLSIEKANKDMVSVDEIIQLGNFSQMVEVMNALSWLKVKGLVKIKEKLDVELSPGINLFIGENGTGKTHLAIALGIACCQQEKQQVYLAQEFQG